MYQNTEYIRIRNVSEYGVRYLPQLTYFHNNNLPMAVNLKSKITL